MLLMVCMQITQTQMSFSRVWKFKERKQLAWRFLVFKSHIYTLKWKKTICNSMFTQSIMCLSYQKIWWFYILSLCPNHNEVMYKQSKRLISLSSLPWKLKYLLSPFGIYLHNKDLIFFQTSLMELGEKQFYQLWDLHVNIEWGQKKMGMFTLCQKFEGKQSENDLNLGFWFLLTGAIKGS